jgi:probable F420-dependent oxidoreductase
VTSAQERSADIDLTDLKRQVGRIGVWTSVFGSQSAGFAREAAAEIERLGYGALWVGETPSNKEALVHAGILLGATRQMVIATGIANIWVRDATAAANGANALAEAYDGRFLLGLGVSHAPLVSARGHDYRKPLAAIRDYLDAMDSSRYDGPLPLRAPRVLAALRTGMLELAARRTEGAHPYFTTPEHTVRARKILGPEPLLAPEQAVVLESDPVRARERARKYTSRYLTLPNYVNNLRDLGWAEQDLNGGGSDALVDAIVPWGDPASVAERIRAHHGAGADHVCVQPLVDHPDDLLTQLRVLAPLLLRG